LHLPLTKDRGAVAIRLPSMATARDHSRPDHWLKP
jgi:hypothetical protein